MSDQRAQKQQVQIQFGPSAQAYATSGVHAKGKSLSQLIDLLEPKSEWRVLDLATAAGHTGHKFAPYVSLIVATDITFEMLPVARNEANTLNLQNVTWSVADAENIPIGNEIFDLVTCRIAAHHFSNVGAFMRESARVLRPEGKVAVVDNVVPGSQLSGKKGKRKREAAIYINAFEKLRDPSHGICYSLDSWQQHFYDAGFKITCQEINQKVIDLDNWSDRMKVSASNRVRLEVMLRQAPAEVAAFLRPDFSRSRIKFYLSEALMIGEKY